MKTSNKILLGVFLTGILVFTGIHILLYANYNKGDLKPFTEVSSNEDFETRPITNKKFIVVDGIGYVRLFAAETNSVRIEKGREEKLHFTESGDTLIIRAASKKFRDSDMHLLVDSSTEVYFKNSTIYLPTAKPTDNLQFTLENSRFTFRDRQEIGLNALNRLAIYAHKDSYIEMNNARINELDLTLANSKFSERGTTINTLLINADSVSTISMSAQNVLKATTKTVTNE